MNVQEIMWNTIQLLRQDLSDLKRCQVQYFALSVTATSAILGLAGTLLAPDLKGFGMLAPLVLLLPCWLIFFDKATTITRIVGYQRLLEQFLTDSPAKCVILGFENALGKFRKAQDAGDIDVPRSELPQVNYGSSIFRVIVLRTRHRYWMLNWYTFFALSFLCSTMAYNSLSERIFELKLPFGIHINAPERTMWGGSAFILVILVAFYTLITVVQLIWGKQSYDANSLAWERLNDIETSKRVERVEGHP